MKTSRLFFYLVASFLLLCITSFAQTNARLADSIRRAFKIPELAYAVVGTDQVYEQQVLGVKKANTQRLAAPDDRFRIGSNTKAITAYIAAQLVHEHKINWSTPFFELFPELKAGSQPAYYQLTLLDLLSFRTRLFAYTYTYKEPKQEQFHGNEEEQRYQFIQWFLQQRPVPAKEINFSNLGYVAAGAMLEKASGKSYKELVTDLGTQLDIHFEFGNPNTNDSTQPWGHNEQLIPEAPGDNFKLEWLLAAGNINVNIGDYSKFIQLQLQGLSGQSETLSQGEFEFLHFGLPTFAVGWFWDKDEQGQLYSYNIGNPGSFLSKVYVHKDKGLAFIFLSNVQSDKCDEGIDLLYHKLKAAYKL